MPLFFADGEAFALGAAAYGYHPATDSDTSPRIFITIGIGDDETSAFVDTGGVYFICTPPFARRIGLDPTQGSHASGRILWRNDWLNGALFRLPLTLPTDEGESITLEVTAFVPVVPRIRNGMTPFRVSWACRAVWNACASPWTPNMT